ncbi:hypothetical protein TIFTF001_020453 [Ficus carica]|uniref:RanBP2-type domain-containing protein n=1 Tax=Ficus carica TaxID=3494 RepID=A0AA88AIG3_FICCA|nr:hypothetical protein TIFTF001_020453 [Ficus carica]
MAARGRGKKAWSEREREEWRLEREGKRLGVREKERNGGENVERERRAINGRRIWAALGFELEFVLESEKGSECNGVGNRLQFYELLEKLTMSKVQGRWRPKSVGTTEVVMKKGDWTCPECNFMNISRNRHCLKCKAEGPEKASVDEVDLKKEV